MIFSYYLIMLSISSPLLGAKDELVRNCIVHNNNDIEDMSSEKQKQLGNFVDKLPGLSAAPAFLGEFGKYGFLKINSEFPIFSIDRIQEFVLSLYDELEKLCKSKAG